jgi:hypothetical protein
MLRSCVAGLRRYDHAVRYQKYAAKKESLGVESRAHVQTDIDVTVICKHGVDVDIRIGMQWFYLDL